MALLPNLPQREITKIDFTQDSRPPGNRFVEQGYWSNGERKDPVSAIWPAQLSETDELFGGTVLVGDIYTLTITPTFTQQGAAAADEMGPATITFTGATDGDEAVDAAIAALSTSATLATPADVDNWNRMRSYVNFVKDPGTPENLQIFANARGYSFTVVVTSDNAGTIAQTIVQDALTAKLYVGLYCAIDRTMGVNGVNTDALGPQYYLKNIVTGTAAADIVGPVMMGPGTEPVEPGFTLRSFGPSRYGEMVPLARYGVPCVYSEAAVPTVEGTIWVRNTAAGDLLPGMVAPADGGAHTQPARGDKFIGATTSVMGPVPVSVPHP